MKTTFKFLLLFVGLSAFGQPLPPPTTAFTRSLLKSADAAAARVTLELGATNMPVNSDQFAIGTGNVLNMKSGARLTNVALIAPVFATNLAVFGNLTVTNGTLTGNGAGLTNIYGISTNAAGLFITNTLGFNGKLRWTDGTNSGTIFAPEYHNTGESILYVNSDTEFNAMGMDLPQPAVSLARFPSATIEPRFAVTFLPTYLGDDVNRYGWSFVNTNFYIGMLSNTVEGVVEANHVLVTHDLSNNVAIGCAYLTNLYVGTAIKMESTNRVDFVTQHGVWFFNPSARNLPTAQIETNGAFQFAGQLEQNLIWGASPLNPAATSLQIGTACEIGSVGSAYETGYADVSLYGDLRSRNVYVGSDIAVAYGTILVIDYEGKVHSSDGLTTNVDIVISGTTNITLQFRDGILTGAVR